MGDPSLPGHPNPSSNGDAPGEKKKRGRGKKVSIDETSGDAATTGAPNEDLVTQDQNGFTRFEPGSAPAYESYERPYERNEDQATGRENQGMMEWDAYGNRITRAPVSSEVYHGGTVYQAVPYPHSYGAPPHPIHGYGPEGGYFSAAASSTAPIPFVSPPARLPNDDFVDDRPDRSAPRTIYNHTGPGGLFGAAPPPGAFPGQGYEAQAGAPVTYPPYSGYSSSLGAAMGTSESNAQGGGPSIPEEQGGQHGYIPQ